MEELRSYLLSKTVRHVDEMGGATDTSILGVIVSKSPQTAFPIAVKHVKEDIEGAEICEAPKPDSTNDVIRVASETHNQGYSDTLTTTYYLAEVKLLGA